MSNEITVVWNLTLVLSTLKMEAPSSCCHSAHMSPNPRRLQSSYIRLLICMFCVVRLLFTHQLMFRSWAIDVFFWPREWPFIWLQSPNILHEEYLRTAGRRMTRSKEAQIRGVHFLQVEVEVNLRPTVSRPVCLGVVHPSGTRDQFFFLLEIFFRQLRVCYSSLTRGRVCNYCTVASGHCHVKERGAVSLLSTSSLCGGWRLLLTAHRYGSKPWRGASF
jgi:hypothetical protein